MSVPKIARLRWYARRAAAMPPAEWLHRARTAARVAAERARPPAPPEVEAPPAGWPRPAGAVPLVTDADVALVRGLPGVVDAARGVGDAILAGDVGLLHRHDLTVPAEPDWHRDLSTGHRYPVEHWSRVDYRNAAGDAKWLWELGRHVHVVHLARAWRLTGDDRYTDRAARHLSSFLAQCPPGAGIQWRVGIELGLRLVAWAWAVEFLRGSPAATPELGRDLAASADAHMAWLERYPSLHSSANNHRIGELVGLVVGPLAFPGLPRGEERLAAALAELETRLAGQVHPDGVDAEGSVGYHAFVLDMCLPVVAALVRAGRPVPEGLSRPVVAMADVLGTLASDGGTLPAIGDDDDAVALELTSVREDPADRVHRRLRAVAMLLDADVARLEPGLDEQTAWLCGPERVGRRDERRLPGSAVFPSGGLAVLRRRDPGVGEVRAVLRSGPFGLPPIFAHSHADQNSVCLSVAGEEVLVDAGTFTYYGDTRWRDYARSTGAHSTLLVDDRDQATPAGPFLWRHPVDGTIDLVDLDPDRPAVRAHHTAHAPLRHDRAMTLSAGGLEVVDHLSGDEGTHLVEIRWHLAPGEVTVAGGRAVWHGAHATVTVEVEGLGPVRCVTGCASRPVGFLSTGLGAWGPSPTLIARARLPLPAEVRTRITAAAA